MSEDREKYQTETTEQDKITLTQLEAQILSELMFLSKTGYDLEAGLIKLTALERVLVASAVSRIGQALDRSMPGWREESR